MAEIKDGFFGFLVQVFDSWAEFLRLRIEARAKDQPVPKDPFVSAPPDHWLEMTAGLSFTDWGTPQGDEGEAPVLPDLSGPAETRAEFESVRDAYPDTSQGAMPPAIVPGSAARSSFIDKRVATPEEAEFVRRQIRTAERTESKASFLSFSDKRSETETGAKFVPAQKPAERLPARFLEITPSAGTESERSAPGVKAHPRVKAAEPKAGTRSDFAESVFVRPFVHDAANNESALQKAAVATPKADSETKSAFIGKGREMQHVPAEFPKRNTATVPAAFSGSHKSSVPVAAAFNKADVSRPRISGPKFSEPGVSESRASAPRVLEAGVSEPRVSEGGAFVNSPSVSFPGHPADFPQRVSPQAGANENAFIPAQARKEIAGVFPPGKNTGAPNESPGDTFSVPASKWADLPELDLTGSTGAPGAENLRRRHLTLLDREQKGERWSV
ncbi:MAG TPA: hypothetical protein VGO50_01480 [Pyrinomonadaceae bacterium]|nr:hypothetical protein [Pyrinomonadaceae bacterium]